MNIQRRLFSLAVSLLAVLSANAAQLLNVNFTSDGNAAFHTKVGPAATGLSSSDVWNSYNAYVPQSIDLLWHDGTSSGVHLSGPGMGAWYTWNTDGMMGSYLYFDGPIPEPPLPGVPPAPLTNSDPNINLELTNVPAGAYDVYVYAHGLPGLENGVIEVVSAGLSQGTKTTTADVNWDTGNWTEGNQYVKFSAVPVVAGQKLIIISKPGAAHPIINGIQIVSSAIAAFPAVVAEPPTNTFAISGGPLQLGVKAIGSGTISYQWSKDGTDIDGATSATFTVAAASAGDSGSYRVKVKNSAGEEMSREAIARVIEPVTAALINVDFTDFSNPLFRVHKSGPAALGRTSSDLWNEVGGTATPTPLKLSDGTASSALVSVENLGGPWFTLNRDPMFRSFIHSAWGDMPVRIHGLAAGSYTLFAYAHGQLATDNGVVQVTVGTNAPVTKSSSTDAAWDASQWTEGNHYVKFSFELNAGDDLVVTAQPGQSGVALLNGLQLLFSPPVPSAPRIATQPLSRTLVVGASLRLTVGATGTAPLRYQWFKGDTEIQGATSDTLEISPVTTANAGTYHARVENDLGSATSDGAIITVVLPAAPTRILNVDCTEPGNAAFHTKVGPAAVGFSTTDYWNAYNGRNANTIQLKWNDGTAAGVSMAGPGMGLWYTWNTDGMMNSYMYGGLGQFEFSQIPPGSYDLLVYAHGILPADIGTIEAKVGGISLGIKQTSSAPDWDKPEWTEGNHYVRFRNVTISPNQKLVVVSQSLINGMQIVPSSFTAFPPVVVDPPLSQLAINGGSIELKQKTIGTPPFTYQWLKDDVEMDGATGATLALSSISSADAGVYKIRVKNAVGSTISEGAVVRVDDAVPGSLLNIDFRIAGHPLFRKDKSGPAAVGQSKDDFWNQYGSNTTTKPLVWANGAASPIKVQTSPISGPWFTFSHDPMMQSFVHAAGATMTTHLTGLPSGQYAVYVYAHGQPPTDNANVEVRVGTTSLGTKPTSSAADWNKPVWTENSQYVRFGNITVNAGQEIQILSKAGVGGLAMMNGVQLVYLNVPTAPKIVSQPKSVTAPEGAAVHFAVSAEGSDPLRYQWLKGTNEVTGATNSDLVIPSILLADADSYSVRVDNGVGSLTSSNAVLTVTIDHDAPVVAITSPLAGPQGSDSFTFSGTIIDANAVSAKWELNGKQMGSLAVANGTFSLAGQHFDAGDNEIRVIASDVSGNVGSAAVSANWTVPRSLYLDGLPTQQEGGRVTIPVMLVSTGGVAGATFLITYNTNQLTDLQFDWGSALADAFVSMNVEQLRTIRATFALPGVALPAGPVQIATVSFRARSVPSNSQSPVALAVEGMYSDTGDPYTAGTYVRSTVVNVTRRKIIADNNANDRLDVGDASIIMRLVSRLDIPRSWDINYNDLNKNANVDSGDVIRVLRAVVGLDPQPVVPGVPPPPPTPFALAKKSVPTALAANSYVTLVADKATAAAGEKVTVEVRLANQTKAINGASFSLKYPTTALRLDSSSANQIGPIVSSGSVSLWNLSPNQNNYATQDGNISLAISSATAWATNNGVLARFTFTVQPGATTAYSWGVQLNNLEISHDGFQTEAMGGSSWTFVGRAAAAASFGSSVTFTAGGVPKLTLTGDIGATYLVEASSDLVTWVPVGSYTPVSGSFTVEDSGAGAATTRFYRATAQP